MSRKLKFVSQGWDLEKHHKEKPEGVSLTVPNEAYTVRELFQKFALGMSPTIVRQGHYDPLAGHDDVDLSKLDAVDLTERDQFAHTLAVDTKAKKNTLKELQDKQAADKKARLEQKRKKVVEDVKNQLKQGDEAAKRT